MKRATWGIGNFGQFGFRGACGTLFRFNRENKETALTEATEQQGSWKARWCWTSKHQPRPWNTYAYFRKTVTLVAEPRRAVVRVSADARYILYVNGRRVHQGPARSFPEHQSFDTIDLSQYLEVGSNTIAAIVHQFGVPTFFSRYRDASGFLLDGVIELEGESIELHTPGGWWCREAQAWRKESARLSVQMGFQEHFDAGEEEANWMQSGDAGPGQEGWNEPWMAGPVGCHPWLKMEPRGVPLLVDHVENFVAVVGPFKGESASGYQTAADVYHLSKQEPRKKERSPVERAPAMLADDGEVTTIALSTESEFVMLVLDLGTYRTGHIVLDIAEAAGGEIVDVIFSDEVDKTGAPLLLPGAAGEQKICEEAPAFRYRCRAGAQRWESFQYLGLRYATLVFRNVVKPLKIRHVALRQVHAGVEKIGAFECGDERLNQIWAIARNTQLNCLFDAFVDCPTREQAQWWGDAHVQSRVTAYAFGDFSLLERGIRQVAQSAAVDGSLHAHPPSEFPGHRLPDFMMRWVDSLWDHYFHTGQIELVRECLPTMHRLFDFFNRHESKNRLIGQFDGFWVFLDWAPLRKADYSATLNLMYLQAVRKAGMLCGIGGDHAGRVRYESAAEALAGSIDTHFWDAAGKVFREGFDPVKNSPTEEVSQHANALAILLNLHPEAHVKIARDVLLKPALARRSKVVTASPFFYATVLEAMMEAGLRKEVVELIGVKWGAFLDRGATTFWEFWDSSGSRCHAWSASPLYLLSRQILGVMPVEPGWAKIRIEPLIGKLEFARGVVPTPFGPIRVEWEKSGDDQLAVRIDVPEGVQAEFVDPAGETRLLVNGANEFHT